ncbi:MAG TPA: hypothetical protein VFK10_08765 [Burkholderiaceae bacterium]|nr:hypothetical protein [Burkholderiaceae bacterium]
MSPVVERFVADCREACATGPSCVRDLIAQAISDPNDLLSALESPDVPGMRTIHRASDLTILHVVWGPKMEVPPHDHRMWAVVGVYAGCEVNRFWRRANGPGLQPIGDATLCAGDAVVLDPGVIHSVANPQAHSTGSIHVYGGDFFAVERSEWASECAGEERFDPQRAVQRFGGAPK